MLQQTYSLLVCSLACLSTRWWGSSGVLSECTWGSVLSGAVLAFPLLTMVSCFCPCQWDFGKAVAATDHPTLCVPPPPPEEDKQKGEKGKRTVRVVGGEKARGKELAGERGRGRWLYFDAKVIRHAWHYSWLGGGGRERQWKRALVSECQWSWSHEVEGQKCITCHLTSCRLRPWTPAKGKTRIDGCRLENERPERSVKKCLFVCVCMRMVGGGRVAELWYLNVTCPHCTATGPSECANAAQHMLWCERWREKCLQSSVLSPQRATSWGAWRKQLTEWW